ncbi:MAG TPA: class I SAM-dependent methyltransferase [Victivallales bacterium]|nr:class I SAM-dependent methyltransferase [Victivallales bacterium]
MNNKIRMNTVLGRRILSLIRHGDYAHPGEEKAIDLAFKNITKDSDRLLLDVGCGLGGTVEYLGNNGYGKVTGIDLNAEEVEFAKTKYPDLDLIAGSVYDIGKLSKIKYDLIYHFCSFYSFPDQQSALTAVREVAHYGSKLIIFDYARNGKYPVKVSEIPNPLDLDQIENMLEFSGWKLKKIEDISDFYLSEYAKFIDKIKDKREDIIRMSTEEMYQHVIYAYTDIYNAYKNKVLKAVIIYAEAI